MIIDIDNINVYDNYKIRNQLARSKGFGPHKVYENGRSTASFFLNELVY